MEPIDVTAGPEPDVYEVTVGAGSDATTHRVHLDAATLTRIGAPGEAAEAFLTRCFAFLLEREPKESILASFDVEVIGRYFPEFETELGGR